MISELPPKSVQREILDKMLQAQNFNQQVFDSQQMTQLQTLQQQHQHLLSEHAHGMTARLTQNASPSKIASGANQMPNLRQKRPSQPEIYSANQEPQNKRLPGNAYFQNVNFPIPQVSPMANPQQMALLQQMQQRILPTPASVPIPMGVRPPPPMPPRPPFAGQGFPPFFNPAQPLPAQNDEFLQNYLRAMQVSGLISPQRPQNDIAHLMALVAANSSPITSVSVDELKKREGLPQIPNIDPNAIAQQLAMNQEELRLFHMRNAQQQQQQHQHQQQQHQQQQQQQQQHHQHLTQLAALAQQQNEQRRRSLSQGQQQPPLNPQFLNAQFPGQSKEPVQNALQSSTPSNQSQNNNNNNMHGTSPARDLTASHRSTPSNSSLSPQRSTSNAHESQSLQISAEEKKFQLFLLTIELFNKRIIEENTCVIMAERLDIPLSLIEAAKYAYLAQITVPSPTITLEEMHPGLRSKLDHFMNTFEQNQQ